MNQPYFRLRQLIDKKFGEQKFNSGCTIVARWVTFETKQEVKKEYIEMMCDTHKAWPIDTATEASLMKLFGLKRREQLYTYPEMITVL